MRASCSDPQWRSKKGMQVSLSREALWPGAEASDEASWLIDEAKEGGGRVVSGMGGPYQGRWRTPLCFSSPLLVSEAVVFMGPSGNPNKPRA